MHLRAENLHVWRGERHVLRGIAFDLHDGQVMQIVGPNGSGKTSLLRTLCGFVYPETGRVLWNGEDARKDLAAFHSSLTYVGHDVPLKPELTVRENLVYWVGLRRLEPQGDIDRSLHLTGVDALGDRLVRTLSAGQKRRAALAGVLALAAPLWLLDEPATNLDAAGQSLVAQLIEQHVSGGGLVIAAVHRGLGIAGQYLTQLELAA
jgi:heme exporter protein A